MIYTKNPRKELHCCASSFPSTTWRNLILVGALNTLPPTTSLVVSEAITVISLGASGCTFQLRTFIGTGVGDAILTMLDTPTVIVVASQFILFWVFVGNAQVGLAVWSSSCFCFCSGNLTAQPICGASGACLTWSK